MLFCTLNNEYIVTWFFNTYDLLKKQYGLYFFIIIRIANYLNT